ncbi:uncharacterized protein EV422DRAFT_508789 [Fimicolochytrium jonesii]|uniref:uncharacterized protein n=1 Tax=Fimicolochytrium jonesii TaxID=1396493 RepID=UPI0022FEF4F8|nr:uncharacterized protein EV422DRAFT_508789 [Fimicolochytrium jonesii]KAI8817718.1 hypothetical protein EV422DRAFT_508789 [Fimicolochytrium jonesii]
MSVEPQLARDERLLVTLRSGGTANPTIIDVVSVCALFIADHLDAASVRRLSLASRALHHLLKDDDLLWRRVFDSSSTVPPAGPSPDAGTLGYLTPSVGAPRIPAAQVDRLEKQYELPFFDPPCNWYRHAVGAELFLGRWSEKSPVQVRSRLVDVWPDVDEYATRYVVVFQDRDRVITYVPGGPVNLMERRLAAQKTQLLDNMGLYASSLSFAASDTYIVMVIEGQDPAPADLDAALFTGPRFHDQTKTSECSDRTRTPSLSLALTIVLPSFYIVWSAQAPYKHLWTIKVMREFEWDLPIMAAKGVISGHHFIAPGRNDELRLFNLRTGYWIKDLDLHSHGILIFPLADRGHFGVVRNGDKILNDAEQEESGPIATADRRSLDFVDGTIEMVVQTEERLLIYGPHGTADYHTDDYDYPDEFSSFVSCISKHTRQKQWFAKNPPWNVPPPEHSGNLAFFSGVDSDLGLVQVMDVSDGSVSQLLRFPVRSSRSSWIEGAEAACDPYYRFAMAIVADAYLVICTHTAVRIYLICEKQLCFLCQVDYAKDPVGASELRGEVDLGEVISLCGIAVLRELPALVAKISAFTAPGKRRVSQVRFVAFKIALKPHVQSPIRIKSDSQSDFPGAVGTGLDFPNACYGREGWRTERSDQLWRSNQSSSGLNHTAATESQGTEIEILEADIATMKAETEGRADRAPEVSDPPDQINRQAVNTVQGVEPRKMLYSPHTIPMQSGTRSNMRRRGSL